MELGKIDHFHKDKPADDVYIHAGHRERMRERFRKEGLDGFNDINALEMLLFYCIPKGDTNPLAHRLLERFGTMQGVMHATYEELRSVQGVGDYIATYLCYISETARRMRLPGEEEQRVSIVNGDLAGEYIKPFFLNDRDEVVRALFLDNQKKPICCRELSHGVVNASEISTRRLAELALECKAMAIILAHNHPGGSLTPSEADIATTIQLRSAMEAIGLELCDHIIVAGEKTYSLRANGDI